MTSETDVDIPVRIEVEQRKFGTNRRFEFLTEQVDAEFVQSQEWRLESLRVETHIRENFAVNSIQESRRVGVVRVNPEDIEWKFIGSGIERVSDE